MTITGGEAEVFPRAAKWYPVTPATAIAATIADTATHGLFLAGVTATGLATLLAVFLQQLADDVVQFGWERGIHASGGRRNAMQDGIEDGG